MALQAAVELSKARQGSHELEDHAMSDIVAKEDEVQSSSTLASAAAEVEPLTSTAGSKPQHAWASATRTSSATTGGSRSACCCIS